MNCRDDGRCQQAIDYGTEGMAACPVGKCVQPQPANCWPCWSCTAPVTMRGRADADGNCPHCGAELDIECWPFPDAAEIAKCRGVK